MFSENQELKSEFCNKKDEEKAISCMEVWCIINKIKNKRMLFVLTVDLKCYPKVIKFMSEIDDINLFTDTDPLSMFQCPSINFVLFKSKRNNTIKNNYFLFHTNDQIFLFEPAEPAEGSESVQLQYLLTYTAVEDVITHA